MRLQPEDEVLQHYPIMHLELQSASNFLVHLIRLSRAKINDAQLDRFHDALVEVLMRRYRDHWFPMKPFKGSGYRCIRINGKIDPVIAQAGASCGLPADTIRHSFPSELTMWIDPKEVSYRIGENGSICVLYEHKDADQQQQPWKPNNSLNNSTNNKTTIITKAKNMENDRTDNATVALDNNTGCKESMRKMSSYMMDSRKSVSIEQLAAYVAS